MRYMMRVVVLAAVMLAFLPGAAAQAAVLNVSPEVGPAGTEFLFFASDFVPGEPISTWLNSPDGQVVAVSDPEIGEATSGGAATWRWESPVGMASGRWQMVVHGKDSGREQLIPFTIGDVAPTPGAPSLVTPESGRAGTLFRFYITGFSAGESVAVSVAGPGGLIEDANIHLTGPASAEGRIDGEWIAPDDAQPGQWYIYLRGTESEINQSLPVAITASEGRVVQAIEVRPSPGARDVPFIISASGFAPNEEISVWLNTPDGRVIAADLIGLAQAGPDGKAAWGWQAAADAPLGTWQMVAHGRESNVELVATFTIER